MTVVQSRAKIMCVDDEPRVLEGLQLSLRRSYEVIAVGSGREALEQLASLGGVPVVISDMRMPVMDGAKFLSQVHRRWPESTRMLLTGDSGREAAAAAINDGQIFRFLTKPCATESLLAAVAAAVKHHDLVVSERVLLRETVIGSLRALVDILALTNPSAFGRTGRIRRLCLELAALEDTAAGWELEAAALVSQLGFVSLTPELADKVYSGASLTALEMKQMAKVPSITRSLLARIPRLEGVVQILTAAGGTPATPGAAAGTASSPMEPRLARAGAILAGAVLFDGWVSRGETPASALAALRAHEPPVAPDLLDHLVRLRGTPDADATARELLLRDVTVGMVLLDELRNEKGTLLVPPGYEISASFLQRLENFSSAVLCQRVRIQPASP